MKNFIVYGSAMLALSAAPLMAQVGSGTSGQGGITPGAGAVSQPPTSGGATDQGGSRPGTLPPDSSTPAQPNAPTGSGARAGKDDRPNQTAEDEEKAGAMIADRTFVVEAAQGGMAAVELGRLAAQKASNPKVKQFAQRMVTDHGKANAELKSLAESKKITIPMDLGEKHQATRDQLAALSGAAFDHAYIEAMVADHKQDVADFRKESENGQDAAVKAFAAKTLPTLEEHMKMVQAVSQGLGHKAVGTSGSAPR